LRVTPKNASGAGSIEAGRLGNVCFLGGGLGGKKFAGEQNVKEEIICQLKL